MKTRALQNFDKKHHNFFLCAKQLSIKGFIDRCNAFEAVPVRREIHKLNAYFILQKIKSECKYKPVNSRHHVIHILFSISMVPYI